MMVVVPVFPHSHMSQNRSSSNIARMMVYGMLSLG